MSDECTCEITPSWKHWIDVSTLPDKTPFRIRQIRRTYRAKIHDNPISQIGCGPTIGRCKLVTFLWRVVNECDKLEGSAAEQGEE